MDPDERILGRRAARAARQIAARARRAPPAGAVERARRVPVRLGQAIVRKSRAILRDHWDVGVFDVSFGCVKAFAVYPALYFAGLAWAIPLAETAPLNTQLWTAVYLFARGKLVSALGRWRYGQPSARLDALRDRLLGLAPRDARAVHRFEIDGAPRLLRVRRSRWRQVWARWRGETPPGVVHPAALRELVGDREFLFRANPLRANPRLYEKVLLARARATPRGRARLWALSVPEPPASAEVRALRATLGEDADPVRARLAEQGDALAAGLRRPRGAALPALALRWLHAALGRALRRDLAALEDAGRRLLADHRAGRALRGSPHWRRVCRRRARLRAALGRAGELVARAGAARDAAAARRLARGAVRRARARGLAVRRARVALWLDAVLSPGPGPEAVCA